MSDTNTDCDYEMTADEACALEEAIQERMDERDVVDPSDFDTQAILDPVSLRSGAREWVLRRFNRS